MISVCLVDDQTLVRQGVKSLLDLSDDIRVVAEASDGAQAVQLIPETQERTGLQAKAPGARVNLEADLIGKYVARLFSLRQDARASGPGLSEDVLRAAGFGSKGGS